MEFDDLNIDTSQLEDRRGLSTGGIVGGGAGVIGLIGLVFYLFFGGGSGTGSGSDPGSLLDQIAPGQGQSQNQVTSAELRQRCAEQAAFDKYDDCFVLKIMNETTEVWSAVLPGYVPPKLVFFTGQTSTACGVISSRMGPLYCPGDERVYFDLAFLNQLQSRFGAQGRYAQAYIAAHEVGHHVQHLMGTDQRVSRLQQQNPRARNPLSVQLELQADCYAGVWGRLANDRGNVKITQAEFQQALNAAAAVGDDRVQRQAGQAVNPEGFTHGTAEQRQQWFKTGYDTGDYRRCDTFSSG